MITESRIKSIENRLEELTSNFLQTQINQVPIIEKVFDSSDNIEKLTPYTETKTAYIDDTELVFDSVPQGNLTVYFDVPYTVERELDRVTINFDALTEVKNVTISII